MRRCSAPTTSIIEKITIVCGTYGAPSLSCLLIITSYEMRRCSAPTTSIIEKITIVCGTYGAPSLSCLLIITSYEMRRCSAPTTSIIEKITIVCGTYDAIQNFKATNKNGHFARFFAQKTLFCFNTLVH